MKSTYHANKSLEAFRDLLPYVGFLSADPGVANTNLATQGNFEGDISGWTANNASVSTSTDEKVNGTKSLKLTITSVATNPAALRTITGLTVGKKYVMTVALKCNSGRTGYVYIDQLGAAYTEEVSTGGWMYLTVEGVATATSATLEIGVGKTGSSVGNIFYLDEVTFRDQALTVEVTGSGYARVRPVFGTPVDGVMATISDTTVPGQLLNQKIQYIAFFDAATGGNLLRYYRVSGDEWIVDTNNPLVIGAGNLIIREA